MFWEKLTQRRLTTYAAGRTDAGVHAAGQVVNFRTQSPMTTGEFQHAFNSLLPALHTRVNAAEEVGPDFHLALGSRWRRLTGTGFFGAASFRRFCGDTFTMIRTS